MAELWPTINKQTYVHQYSNNSKAFNGISM